MILPALVVLALTSPPTFEDCVREAQAWTPVRERCCGSDCGEAVRDYLLRSPSEADREAGWAAYAALPPGEFRRWVLDTFVLRHLYDATAHLPDAVPSPARVDLPRALVDYRRLRDMARAVAGTERAVGPAIPFAGHQQEFEAAVVAFLRGGPSAVEAEAKLARFEWKGAVEGWRERMWLDQLSAARWAKRGRYAAAASVLFERWWNENAHLDRPRRKLLAAAGFDWQRVYVGTMLEDHQSAAFDVARDGHPTAALWLLAANHYRPEDTHGWREDPTRFLAALAAFVRRTDRCQDPYPPFGVRLRDGKAAAPPELQTKILDLLGQRALAPGLDTAQEAGELLAALCRPESVPVFHAMLRSPFHRVREHGRDALKGFERDVPPIQQNPSVVFRLLVDGVPVASRNIAWGAGHVGKGVMSSATTDNDGALALPRDYFLDPEMRVDYVVFHPGPAVTGQSWFRSVVTSHALRDLDAIPPVSISTQALSVRCASGRSLSIAVDASQDGQAERHVAVKRAPFTSPVHEMPRLDRSLRYHVILSDEQGWTWQSEPVVLGETPVVLDCPGPAGPAQSSAF